MNRWPNQVRILGEVPRLVAAGVNRLLVASPTGSGKSRSICDLIEWGCENGWRPVLYTNRRLLIDQLARTLDAHGIGYGIRAAGHQDNRERPVQISSLPTERQRVLKSELWDHHGRGERVLAIVDEAHLNAADTARQILDRHLADGGAYVGFTATPIDLGHLYDHLFVAATPSEMRACGALVPAHHFGPDEPDMRKFKPNQKTGEYKEGDVKKAIMTKCVFARVLDNYRELNPDGRPTILFAPGVPESVWFAQQLCEAGVRAAHLDGNGVWLDGEYRRGEDRQAVFDAVKSGAVKILCNRFVLREGLDIPEVSHLILATVMGSLQTYLQSCGRGLRAAPGKDRCTVQDHGGHWWRHGSVNADREWALGDTERVIQGTRGDAFREHRDREPIRCPECGMIRQKGPRCPKCGHEASRSVRRVIQQDGTLKEHSGLCFPPRRVALKPDTVQVWTRMYHRSKKAGRTFRAAEALFFQENRYWPPRDLPLMPTRDIDFYQKVSDVPVDMLTH